MKCNNWLLSFTLIIFIANPTFGQRYDALFNAVANGNIVAIKQLIRSGADVNEGDFKGWTPLIHSSKAGHLEVVKVLAKSGAEINKTTDAGCSPLAFAASEGHLEIVKFLLDNGADPSLSEYESPTPLVVAAEKGYDKCLDLLLNSGADIDGTYHGGYTALMSAAEHNQLSIAEKLLKAGADIHVRVDSDTALGIAAFHGHSKMVELLLSYGAGIKRTGRHDLAVFDPPNEYLAPSYNSDEFRELPADRPGKNADELNDAIKYAARGNQMEIAERLSKALRQAHATPLDSTKVVGSEICSAAARGDLKEVKRLYRQNPQLPMNELGLAVQLADQEGRLEVSAYLHSIAEKAAKPIIQELMLGKQLREASQKGRYQQVVGLLYRGVDVDSSDTTEYTPLCWAAFSGKKEVVELLLRHGADVNHVDVYDESILASAASNNKSEVVELLLAHGAKVDDKTGGLALIYLADQADVETIRQILDGGVDINSTAHEGMTALMKAAEGGNLPVVKLLISRGADVNQESDYGYTALMWAQNEYYDDVAMALRSAGAIESENIAPTPLYSAIRRGDIQRVKYLIKKGVDLKRRGYLDRLPVRIAMESQKYDIATALLDAGAPTHPSDIFYLTYFANDSAEIVEIMRRLIEAGADVNSLNNSRGQTPLMAVAGNNKLNMLEALIKAGARLDLKDNHGNTALALAINSGNHEAAAVLRQAGATH